MARGGEDKPRDRPHVPKGPPVTSGGAERKGAQKYRTIVADPPWDYPDLVSYPGRRAELREAEADARR